MNTIGGNPLYKLEEENFVSVEQKQSLKAIYFICAILVPLPLIDDVIGMVDQ